ncbi:hypothetical protein PACTADRAFT_31298 [Pachysolen tannophilus NRRL Y-2460]|uniref:Uncharacterized protein n=1 Tax=Pachysolen tannophilus NRRL Y-2460 TaxID=669874 RepID=A0A1E4U1J3_PACTA|nr:hypothetical protein PACTADRAFT_31298 [Pachysolen tannophilus NRRL Y-2460]
MGFKYLIPKSSKILFIGEILVLTALQWKFTVFPFWFQNNNYSVSSIFLIIFIVLSNVFIIFLWAINYLSFIDNSTPILDEVIIREYLELRPSRDLDPAVSRRKWEKIAQSATLSVTKSLDLTPKDYSYSHLDCKNRFREIIRKFDNKLSGPYVTKNLNEIRGFDKVLMVALNMWKDDTEAKFEKLNKDFDKYVSK